jgi:ABC-2 type transport system permease protein
MFNQLRAEAEKLRTTQMAYGLTAILIVCVIAFTALRSLSGDAVGLRELSAIELPRGVAPYFAVVLGILVVTTDFRFRTITWSYLNEPRRIRVMAAKLIISSLAGLVLGILAVGLALVIAAVFGDAPRLGIELAGTTARIGVVCAIYAALGVAIGALTRNQVGALSIAVLGLPVGENLLGVAVPSLFLPSGAASVLEGLGSTPPWQGALVLLCYVTVTGAVAARLVLIRDLT